MAVRQTRVAITAILSALAAGFLLVPAAPAGAAARSSAVTGPLFTGSYSGAFNGCGSRVGRARACIHLTNFAGKVDPTRCKADMALGRWGCIYAGQTQVSGLLTGYDSLTNAPCSIPATTSDVLVDITLLANGRANATVVGTPEDLYTCDGGWTFSTDGNAVPKAFNVAWEFTFSSRWNLIAYGDPQSNTNLLQINWSDPVHVH
jgi:hypothetical protein